MDDRESTNRLSDAWLYCALACAITWSLDAPLALAWWRHETPPSYALPLVGLGAFGPTVAAVLVAAWRKSLREVFGRWRTSVVWVTVALLLPMAVTTAATAIDVASGGHPAHWFYPPDRPEYVAALVVFSVGEEFGWRGFAYPRLAERFGPLLGSVIVGVVWGVWHFGMMFTAERGAPTLFYVVAFIATLTLWSVVFAWVFERGARSMAVALALHAGGHLDNINHAPESDVRVRVVLFLVLGVVALFAGRALVQRVRRTSAAITVSTTGGT